MIAFEKSELLLSVLMAVAYGAGFSVLLCAVDIILGSISAIPRLFREVIVFDSIMPPPRFKKDCFELRRGPIYIFLAFMLFAVGFCLLSYVSLDGEIRLYMLILSFASFYLSKIAFFDFLRRAFLRLYSLLLTVFAVVFRCLVFPLKMFVRFVKKAQKA